jgi:hypothetical protein
MGTRVTAPTFVGGVLYTPDGPDVPDDIVARIGAHLLPEGYDAPAGDDGGDKGDGGEPPHDPNADPQTPTPAERPNGRHGWDTWLRYAGEQGVDVPDDVVQAEDKARLIDLVEKHEADAAAAAGAAPQGDPGAGNGQDA